MSQAVTLLLADAACDIAKKPLGSGQRGLPRFPSTRPARYSMWASTPSLGSVQAMMDEPEPAIERCERLHHRAREFVAARRQTHRRLNSASSRAKASKSCVRWAVFILAAISANCCCSELAGSRGRGSDHERLDNAACLDQHHFFLRPDSGDDAATWGRIKRSRSRASRCIASRTGVRPIPSWDESSASDTGVPGGNCSVQIISSSRL